jgi:hypothetical protein
MPTKPDHKPAGPGGGQFTYPERAEASVALDGPSRPLETQRERRGHDFYPPAEELAAWPKLYATDNDGPIGDKPIQAHYFQGGMDFYVAEYDPKEKEAFGYTDLGHGGEWGYMQLDDIEELRGQFGLPIERDLDFKPGTPAKECIPRYVADAAAEGDKAAIETLQDQAVEAILRDVLADDAADKLAAIIGNEPGDEDDRYEFEWPEEQPDPMSPEDRKLWDGFHRHAYDFGHSVLGVTGFEDRDTVERFAGFAADAYQENGWNGEMDIHGVVDDWMAQERPLG